MTIMIFKVNCMLASATIVINKIFIIYKYLKACLNPAQSYVKNEKKTEGWDYGVKSIKSKIT